MDNKETLQEFYSLRNEIHVKNSNYTKWDRRMNYDILDKLEIKPEMGYIQNYQRE
jgi:hypothetical protein